MLRQVLTELQQADGPVNMDDLCRKLDVDRSVLDEMITFWVRKGKLINTTFVPGSVGSCPHCASSDCTAQGCHTEDKMPRTFVVRR
jgi:hypothetical protein